MLTKIPIDNFEEENLKLLGSVISDLFKLKNTLFVERMTNYRNKLELDYKNNQDMIDRLDSFDYSNLEAVNKEEIEKYE